MSPMPLTGLVVERVSDFDELTRTLDMADLPSSDILLPGRRRFRYAGTNDALIGFRGLEGTGEDLLLRSVVVRQGCRAGGYGRTIVLDLEGRAAVLGGVQPHLLTMAAEGLFKRLGCQVANRADAPRAVAGTVGFASLCPDSTHDLCKSLAPQTTVAA